MHKIRVIAAATALVVAGSASAGLHRVGPTNLPSPAGHGFPTWYQDNNGMVLDLCLPDLADAGNAQALACFLPFNPPSTGFVFPTLFPDEMFYFNAGAGISTGGGKSARLVIALEGAFGAGAPAVNDQMVFARIRIVAGVPFPGTYTVRHPYGTSTHFVETIGAGNRDIFDTIDIGLAPLDFKAALNGSIGPFLEHVNGAVSAQDSTLPPVQSRYTVNGATMLGDGNDLGPVTGSPFGTNFFEMCGPFDGPGPVSGPVPAERCISSADFSLVGRLHNGLVGSPLAVERANYNRSALLGAITVDVAANAVRGLGQLAPVVSVGGPHMNPILMRGPEGVGRFYAQGIPVPPETLERVTITNSGDVPPTSQSVAIVDAVTITRADYVFTPSTTAPPGRGTLIVEATSSDKLDAPSLRVEELPGAVWLNLATTADPAKQQLSQTDMLVPPVQVTVTSARGGNAVRDVTIVNSTGAYAAGAPFAQDDAISVAAGSGPIAINVVVNDKSGIALTAGSVAIVAAPALGSATAAANQITYTPPATPGTATIGYTVSNAVGKSNIGIVTVTVTSNASPTPTAVNDSVTLPARTSLTFSVLANDSSNGTAWATTNPVQLVGTPANVSVNAAGMVTYVSPLTTLTAGSTNFQYRAVGANGNVSASATVTVNWTAPESLLVNTARCTRPAQWELRGTSSYSSGSVDLFNAGTPGAGVKIATVPITAGAWQFKGTNAAAPCSPFFSIRSNLGTVLTNRAVTVK